MLEKKLIFLSSVNIVLAATKLFSNFLYFSTIFPDVPPIQKLILLLFLDRKSKPSHDIKTTFLLLIKKYKIFPKK